MTHRCEHVFTSAHAELLRAAYVTMAGLRSRESRWAQAHRIVAASLPLRSASVPADSEEKVYLRLLVRVLRRAMKPPPLAGLLSWLNAATPGGGQSQVTVDQALAKLPAPARAAYYLHVAEERPGRADRGRAAQLRHLPGRGGDPAGPAAQRGARAG